MAKPDPAIFGHAVELFDGLDRSRIVYLGDSVTIDVEAASAAGLRPVLLDPYDDHVGAPFERIREVGDLLSLRAKLSYRSHATVTKWVLFRP